MQKIKKKTIEKIKNIMRWQNSYNTHPLTCKNNSEHILEPFYEDEKIILKCNECDYQQDKIPEVVLKYSYKNNENNKKQLDKLSSKVYNSLSVEKLKKILEKGISNDDMDVIQKTLLYTIDKLKEEGKLKHDE